MSKKKNNEKTEPELKPMGEEVEPQNNEEDPVDQPAQPEDSTASTDSGPDETPAALDPEAEKIQQTLEKTEEQLLRLQAEFLNYKRRVEKEKSELHFYGCETLAKDLLPVIDSFERALESIQEKDSGYYQGIDMVKRQMLQALEKHEITEIQAVGEPFDMQMHHAVMTENCEKEELRNTVADVMQKGYKMKNRVLRPSMVKVYQ